MLSTEASLEEVSLRSGSAVVLRLVVGMVVMVVMVVVVIVKITMDAMMNNSQ